MNVSDVAVTDHAHTRMNERCIPDEAVLAALEYGRVVHTRGARIHVIGRKEVERFRHDGVDLEDCEGVHVVCTTDGVVMTVYKNFDLRGLRPCRRRHGSARNRRRWFDNIVVDQKAWAA